MKTGIQISAMWQYDTPDAQYARLRELGYEAVDETLSNTNTPWYADRAVMEEHCLRRRAAAEKYGIDIWQVHGPWPTDDTTPTSRQQVWEYMHHAVYGAHCMGAKHLVIHPQMPFGWGDDRDPEFARQLTLDLMRDLLPDCERYNVILCLENMPMRDLRLSTMDRIVEVVKSLDSPYAAICLDTGHTNVYERDLGYDRDLSEDVRICAPWLRTLHVHDNRLGFDLHLLPYRGTIDWEAFTKALALSGYEGPLMLETTGPASRQLPLALLDDAQRLTAHTARYLADAVELQRSKLSCTAPQR